MPLTCCQHNIMANLPYGNFIPNPCLRCGRRWLAAWPCESTSVKLFKNGDVRVIDISRGEDYIERKDIILWYKDYVIYRPRLTASRSSTLVKSLPMPTTDGV